MIDASLNEVESLASKAARGAGLAWGLAEETGRAARWLAACDAPWAGSLLVLLARHVAFGHPLPHVFGFRSAIADAPLSPLVLGPYLADCGPSLQILRLADVASPMWLVPFASQVAAAAGQTIELVIDRTSISSISMIVDAGTAHATAEPWLALDATETVTWGPPRPNARRPNHFPLPRMTRSLIGEAEWAALERLGANTYVPASTGSRTRGAGAGLVDND